MVVGRGSFGGLLLAERSLALPADQPKGRAANGKIKRTPSPLRRQGPIHLLAAAQRRVIGEGYLGPCLRRGDDLSIKVTDEDPPVRAYPNASASTAARSSGMPRPFSALVTWTTG